MDKVVYLWIFKSNFYTKYW